MSISACNLCLDSRSRCLAEILIGNQMNNYRNPSQMDDLCIAVITCSLCSCLPRDIHLKIASFLPPEDVWALGRCSRYWRELCRSNCIWKSLSIKRWPPLSTLFTHQIQQIKESRKDWHPIEKWPPQIQEIQDWKRFYYQRQSYMFALAGSQKYNYTGWSDPRISLPDSLCKQLAKSRFSLIDVEMFSFCPRVRLFNNMIGVLYSITCLKVPRKLVAEALRRRNIHDREVVIRRPSVKILYRVLVPSENWDSILTLEDVALARRGRTKAVGHIRGELFDYVQLAGLKKNIDVVIDDVD